MEIFFICQSIDSVAYFITFCLFMAFVCVSFENIKSTIELNTKKTNSGTEMMVEREANISEVYVSIYRRS